MCPGGKERAGPAVPPLQNCNRPESGSAMSPALPVNVLPMSGRELHCYRSCVVSTVRSAC
jgi:hypothetical protein